MIKQLSFAFVVGTFACGAFAQQLYKVVGPDGKVTFSDRPALEKANKLSVMKSYMLRPVESPKHGEAKQEGVPAVAVDPNATITPEVEEAMLSVMNMTQLGRQYAYVCSTSDAGTRAFTAAMSNWRKRNAPYVEQQKRLLMEVMSPTKRAALQDKSTAAVNDMGNAIPPTPDGRKEWCSGTIAELDSGRSDLNKPAMLSIPITRYKAK